MRRRVSLMGLRYALLIALLIALAAGVGACARTSIPSVPLSTATPRAQVTKTPPPVQEINTAVSVALPFDQYTTAAAEAKLGVALVWGSQAHGIADGITRLFYTPYDRNPDPRYYAPAHDLAWFQANHPDWIEYQADRKTVAYDFGDPSDVPLDITNSAVLRYLQSAYYLPAVTTGGWQGIGFDNLALQNTGSWSGQRAGHYDASGAWVQQWSGQYDDPAYRSAVLHWEQTMYSWLRSSVAGAVMGVNFSYDDQFEGDSLAVWANTDIIIDEEGWTRGDLSPAIVTDGAWRRTANWVAAGVAQRKRIFSINQEPVPFARLTTTQVQWALANYLLTASGAGWIYICGPQEYGYAYMRPEYAAPLGSAIGAMSQDSSGVYQRSFTQGLALVNPSGAQTVQVVVRPNTYEDLYGHIIMSSPLSLGPASGLVLLRISSSGHLNST